MSKNETESPKGKPTLTGALELPAIPDFLGTAHRVERVASLIQGGQEQIRHLQTAMMANGESEDDVIEVAPLPQGVTPPPNWPPQPETYRERVARLDEGIAMLMAENQDIREELIAEAVRRRDAVQKLIAKRHEDELKSKQG